MNNQGYSSKFIETTKMGNQPKGDTSNQAASTPEYVKNNEYILPLINEIIEELLSILLCQNNSHLSE